mmetsp:Transcript_8797/g.15090  ORF Transcript_8797/g.15090 Transcript_8797/m.15090 type:complete len:219 (-) Transcript_8797:722-1378(-)
MSQFSESSFLRVAESSFGESGECGAEFVGFARERFDLFEHVATRLLAFAQREQVGRLLQRGHARHVFGELARQRCDALRLGCRRCRRDALLERLQPIGEHLGANGTALVGRHASRGHVQRALCRLVAGQTYAHRQRHFVVVVVDRHLLLVVVVVVAIVARQTLLTFVHTQQRRHVERHIGFNTRRYFQLFFQLVFLITIHNKLVIIRCSDEQFSVDHG